MNDNEDLKNARDEHAIDVDRDDETERMLERVVAANKEKKLRVAKDRVEHNKKVTRDYRLKR